MYVVLWQLYKDPQHMFEMRAMKEYHLRAMDMCGRFLAIFAKVDNFWDLLLSLRLYIPPLRKGFTVRGEFASLGANSFLLK